MFKHQLLRGLFIAVTLLSTIPCAIAQTRSAASEKLSAFGGDPHLAKLSSELLSLLRPQPRRSGPFVEVPLALPSGDGRIEAEIWLKAWEEDTLISLQQLGLEVIGSYPDYSRVVALLPVSLLTEVAALKEVASIRYNQRPYSMKLARPRSADGFFRCPYARSQADTLRLFGTWKARKKFGFDGSGIKIGILSDSFRTRLQGTTRQESGDETGCGIFFEDSDPQARGELPSSIQLLDNGPGDGSDEGRALAELIHDLAPGAEILFHTGTRGMADFAQGIRKLADCGADIIVDDLLHPREPMFQAGMIESAAQEVADPESDNPRLYLSSAGNQGDGGIFQFYQDPTVFDEATIPATGADFHEFAPGRRFAKLDVEAGCGIQLVLQWDEPFPEMATGEGAETDLDLYLCLSADPDDCPYGSIAGQGCSLPQSVQPSEPIEITRPIVNTSDRPQTVFVAVDHFCGDPGVAFRIVTLPIRGSQCNLDQPEASQVVLFDPSIFDAPQIYGHASAQNVAAVGAIDYREIESEGALQFPFSGLNAQPYSALGGEIPSSQRPEAPSQGSSNVVKPEFTAPDATNTTFFDRTINLEKDDNPEDPDICPNFLGTSAAAAHAAGAAALVMEANPDLTPQHIIEILQQSATPLADQDESGVGRRSGAGLINAFKAVKEAKMRPAAPVTQTFADLPKNPILKWSEVPQASAYRVEVREAETRQRVLSEQTSQRQLAIPSSMFYKGYEWRVSAVNSHGEGGWSRWTRLGPPSRRLPPKQ